MTRSFAPATWGIDIVAKFEIYRLLRDLIADGKLSIVVSSELPELFAVCDRVTVLSAGLLVHSFSRDEFDAYMLMAAALTHDVRPRATDSSPRGAT